MMIYYEGALSPALQSLVDLGSSGLHERGCCQEIPASLQAQLEISSENALFSLS